MCWLNRRNDAVFTKRAKVIWINYLRMFNSPATIIFTLQYFTVSCKNNTVTRVTDGVCAHLEVVFKDPCSHRVIMVLTAQKEACSFRLVHIRSQQTSPT